VIFLEFGVLDFVKFILRFFLGVDILNAKGAKFFLIIEIFSGSQRRFAQRFLLLADFGDFADFHWLFCLKGKF